MKQIITTLTLLLIVFCLACKKKEKVLPTDMRAAVNKDTVMRTTYVTAKSSTAGPIYINGVTEDGDQKLMLTITGYQGVKGVFKIDYRGPGGNMTGNTGYYLKGINEVMARSGNITITAVEADVLRGTFTLFYDQTEIRGSFVSPKP